MKNLFTLLFCVAVLGLQAQVLTEDFENGIPEGWTASGDWALTDAAGAASQYYAPPAHTQFMVFNDDALGNGAVNSGEIVTTEIDLTGLASPAVSFESYFINGDYQGDETAKVNVSTDGGATWTEVASLDGAGEWEEVNVPLVDYIDQTVMISFAYDDDGSWQYGWSIDDIVVGEFVFPDNDVEFTGFYQGCMRGEVGRDAYFKGYFVNNGLMNLTSVDLNFTAGGNTVTESLTDIDVAPGEQYQFVHPAPYTLVAGSNDLEFTITNPNGVEDENPDDNSFSFSIDGVTVTDGKGVMIEEATGTWCTFCPRGTILMDMMSTCFPDNFVGIAVHNADPMVNNTYDAFVTGQPGFSGFPSVFYNREGIEALDQAALTNASVNEMQDDVEVSLGISADYDEATRVINARVFADFIEAPGSGAKWVGIISENNVTGTAAGYNQINAYAGDALGSMGGYEALPGSVPAAQMVYDLVGRDFLTPVDGSDADLDDMEAGGSAMFEFESFTLPNAINAEETDLTIALVNDDGEVINVKQISLMTAAATGIDPVVLEGAKVRVFPNPTSDVANIRITLERPMDVNVEVFNIMGQTVAVRDYGLMYGDEIIPMNVAQFATGTYMVRVSLDDQVITKQIVVE